MRSTFIPLSLVAAGLLAGAALPAHAQSRIVEIDELTQGTVFDGIIDGFPELAAKDGTPDFGGNALAVALKADVTELRSAMEFPLAELSDVPSEEIVAATLVFNVDDVLSTFGPGTAFNGRAAASILVHPYDGDGAVTLSDYRNRDEEAWVVDTGPGTITDASLNGTGAVVFDVDVRDRLLAALDADVPFIGFLWRTTDSPTGTSLDDLGEGSSGPPGARGSRMPFLSVEIEDAEPPPGCGNGAPDAGETCDDGNVEDGDCCSRRCQRDAPGTVCENGDACTVSDTCDAAGACVAGTARSCDDDNVCTTDSCDPGTGCLNLVTNEGEPCDDRNVCTAGDTCGGGNCRGTPTSGDPCDDGDACSDGDVCTEGVCTGEPLCGNGVIDTTCAEECDAGNASGLDGCSATCTFDALLGGKGRRECLLQIAFAAPTRSDDGDLAAVQRCRDGDAACDAEPAPDVCGFMLAACLGQADPRLPECAPAPVSVLGLRKPGRKDRANRTRLEETVDRTAFPGCTEPLRIDVPVKRTRNGRVRPGKVKVVLATKAPGIGRDRDRVKLVCDPAA
jgi:cysteine-rich repeat protein